MNLIGRKFQNKSGKVCIVKSSNEDTTTFVDNSYVGTEYLFDKKYFIEIPQEFQPINNNYQQPQNNYQQPQNNQQSRDPMDPANFLAKSNNLFGQTFLNQLNSAIGKLPDRIDEGNYYNDSYNNNNGYNNVNNVAVLHDDPELQKEEIARKYGITNATTVVHRDDLLSKQANAFMSDPKLAKILEEEGQIPPTNMRQQSQQPQQSFRDTIINNTPPESRSTVSMSDTVIEKNPNVSYNTYIDPIITMFRKAKRPSNFKINVDIEKKIPRLDYIEMMMESYPETSIIECLAQEFTDSIINNPDVIKDKIVAKLTQMLEASQEKVVKVKSPKVDSKIEIKPIETKIEQIKTPVPKAKNKKASTEEKINQTND